MITEYVTSSGFRLGTGRIDRRKIDKFAGERPVPEPPMKTAADLGIAVFGGVEDEELLPIWDDPGYLMELQDYYQKIGDEEFDLIAGAINLLDAVPKKDLQELREFEIDVSDPADFLRFTVLNSDKDMTEIVALVFYNSTVTARGMMEAAKTFNVTFRDEPVALVGHEEGQGKASPLFSHRRAARASNYTWEEFCELPGPEQSTVVAFHRLEGRLQWLMSKK